MLQQYLQQWCKPKSLKHVCLKYYAIHLSMAIHFLYVIPNKRIISVDRVNVTRIIVNESKVKPEQYVVKDFNLNFKDLVATTPFETNGNVTGGGDGYIQGGVRGMIGQYPKQSGKPFQEGEGEVAVDAKNVLHPSLSEGLDNNYPFGNPYY